VDEKLCQAKVSVWRATLQVREHTTDTHGYTEIVFALCHLLGFYFMPRIRDLKDQQLYRVDRLNDYGVFTPLLTKAADLMEALSAGVSR
jgi:TnpA family transposase